MNTLIHCSATWFIFALWQSTLLLGVSFLLAKICVKTPWRAHVFLCTGIFAAVLAPTFSTVIAIRNGGIWQHDLTGVLGILFVLGAILFLLLLFYGVMMSRKLMFHAKPFPDRESQEALLAGAKVLQNVSLPILFTSDEVKSPTVWCWGLHPAVLLPEELTAHMPAEERDAVFLHELAHITRRDHLTALFCRLCGTLLFWHPLFWLALWQSDLLADEACDLLVLSRGTVSPGDYSETLLKLAAGEKFKPAFQFLSRKEKIMRRINKILDFADRPNLPPAGSPKLWTATVVTLALIFSAGLAFCQEMKNPNQKPTAKSPQIVKMEPANGATDVDADAVKELRVTFDRDMDTSGFSWTGGGETFPETTGKPKWINKRTCVLPVKLKPDWNYRLGINARDFKNFKSKSGIPVTPVAYTFSTSAATENKVKVYDVDKNVSDYPDAVDLSTPEAAYALTNRAIASDNPDKINEIAQYTRMQTIPKNMIEWIEGMTPETRESMRNAKILKVLVYKNRDAMVIAEIEPEERYNTRLLANENGRWFNAGGGGFVKGNRETCLKNFEAAFMKAVARWDSEKETTVWKTPDNVGHTHMAIFEPAGDFDPQTPQELLDKLNETLFQRKDVVTGYFRTGQDKDMKLIGRICTNNPGGLKEVIESIPELQLVKIGALTAEVFEKHSGMKMNRDTSGWHTPDEAGHTHLFIFAGKGNFKPQTPVALLEMLNKTLFQTKVATGYFRTWPEDGRLIGGICTNDEDGLKSVFEKIPQLELIKVEALNEKLFEEHMEKGQLSLSAAGKAAPKIVKMEPANGATDVDADTVKELRVTFDRDMNTDGFSWTGGGDTYPETTGESKWLDKRTCVLPVKLKESKTYVLGINSKNYRNFKSANGPAVEPVIYTFATGGNVNLLEGMPIMKDLEKDAKPYPAELVEKIWLKRRSLQSAEYAVELKTASKYQDKITTRRNTTLFRFQGNDQWYVDISDVMSFSDPGLDERFHSKCTFFVGCDGSREWCYVKNDKDKEPYYNERDLKNIKEKHLSFLDPFSCVETDQDQMEELFQKRGIRYLGEGEFEGKNVYLFGYAASRSMAESQYEIAIDTETLLPTYTREMSAIRDFGPSDNCYLFKIKEFDKKFSNDDFHQTVDKESKPEIKDKPDEGYEYFFVTIDDGADGRMTVRGNGQRGEKGTSSSGLN